MNLDISALESAITRLQEGIARYRQDTGDTQIRDGLIQRFEFTYELSHRMLKRYLEMVSPNPEQFDEMAFANLVRTGNEQELLAGDWSRWKLYREMRARSSNTYAEKVALEVVAVIPEFLAEAVHLRDRLRARLA